MKVEVRADDVFITGYVNVTEKKSRPVLTKYGKVIEVVEERAFDNAIHNAGNVTVTVDHDSTHIYASTEEGTLELKEDGIGMHATVLITDKTIIDLAKKGKIKGWSFGMYNVVDELEERANDLPIRHIKKLDLDHITLVVDKNPVYSATSVEVRAEEEIELETRTDDRNSIEFVVEKEKVNYNDYKLRILKLRAN